MQTAIPATLMRGGTSKGLYFLADDLPTDEYMRNCVLLAAMGSPDIRQIDGLGGAHPLTSKVAILSPSTRADADIDYYFLQVFVDEPRVSDSQPCGNILAGVGPWAIEQGLVKPNADITPVRIHTINNGSMATAFVATPRGKVDYTGDTAIDGVPGTAAAIPLDFLDIAGSNCGSLFPTGNLVDRVDGLEITCVDNGMPVILLRAGDLGLNGSEEPETLEANDSLRERIEEIRLIAGPMMNLGDVSNKTVPKMTIISEPTKGGAVSTRSFIPHRVHEAIGVLGAVSVATACGVPGTVADAIANIPEGKNDSYEIEHPTGAFSVNIDIETSGDEILVRKSALIRTARKLMHGEVYVPYSVWSGQ